MNVHRSAIGREQAKGLHRRNTHRPTRPCGVVAGLLFLVVTVAPGCAPFLGTSSHDGPQADSGPVRPAPRDQQGTVSGGFEPIDFVLEETALLGETTQLQEIWIDQDPYFKRPQAYLALPLQDLVKLKFPDAEQYLQNPKIELGITFVSLDRRRLTLPLREAQNGRVFLATAEARNPPQKPWTLLPQATSPETLGPFMLLLSSPAPSDETFLQFPRVVKLILTDLNASFSQVFKSDQPVEPAVTSFLLRCSSCHTLHGQGTQGGIDLAAPVLATGKGAAPWLNADAFNAYVQSHPGSGAAILPRLWTKEDKFDAVFTYLNGVRSDAAEAKSEGQK